MAGTHTLQGLPHLSFPRDTPVAELLEAVEQALIDYPEHELDSVRLILCFASGIKEKHALCLKAADRLFELAEDDEDRMDSLITKAEVLWEIGTDLDTAEKLLIDAHTIDPSYPQPYEQLCDIYMERKEYAKALLWGDMALKQEYFTDMGLRLRGKALLGLNRIDEAMEMFRAGIDRDDQAYAAHFGLAQGHMDKEQYQLAIPACLAAFEKCHYPEPIYAFFAGYCYQHIDDPYRAMKWYAKTLEIEPSFPDALNNMALIHLQLNSGWEEAVPFLHKAVMLSNESTDPSMQRVYVNLQAYYTQILDKEKAKYYQRLVFKCSGLGDGLSDFLTNLLDEDYDGDYDE